MAYNILIVDDSATTRAVVKRTVMMSGVDVGEIFQAENGKVALDVLDQNWVDLVLADLNMPEMNGIEMTQKMQAQTETQSIPVVVVSTEASTTRIEELKKHGVKGYVHKPFTPEDIRNVLTELLGDGDE